MSKALDPNSGSLMSSRRARLIGVVVLTVVAAIPRFYHLGNLSFYSDEDLTALAARSVLHGEGARMPSGMPYLRALPFTWMNAGAAAVMGEDNEASYRVTSAIFGTMTPAAVFLTGSAFVSPPAALVGGVMLALSEWHIAFSRIARMYTAFLFFFVLCGFFMWRWAREGGTRNLLLALLFFVGTSSLHLLGLFAVEFALIPLVLPGRKGPSPFVVVTVALAAAAAAFGYDRFVVGPGYAAWLNFPDGFTLEGTTPGAGGVAPAPGANLIPLLAAIGGLVGLWLGWPGKASGAPEGKTTLDRLLPPVAIAGAAVVAGAFVGAGFLWGAVLSGTVLLLIQKDPVVRFVLDRWKPFALLAAGSVAWAAYAVIALGVSEGARRIATFPFPYMAFFALQFPGLIVLFLGAILWMLLSRDRLRSHVGLVAAVLGVLMPMTAIGLARDWGGTRYLFQVYPYLILAGAAFLVWVTDAIVGLLSPAHRLRWATASAVVLVLAGITGAHGLAAAVRVATLEHGEPVNRYVHMFALRPDLRGPALFVKNALAPGDVVIAEQQETTSFYLGRADYWFRRAGDARAYVHLDEDGTVRDIYAGAVLLTTPESVEDVVASAKGHVWLLTSGETAPDRDYYLSEAQRNWLDSVETNVTPAYVGEDGLSRAFCLNCP